MLIDFGIETRSSPLEGCPLLPWQMTADAEQLVAAYVGSLGEGYAIYDGVAVHRTAQVDETSVLKAPSVIGPNCFVGGHTLLRGGVWLAANCVIGPGCEIKSSFLFEGARLAHFNFVGDSIVGPDVNLEAGSIVANTRNERAGPITVRRADAVVSIDVPKFGAVIGSGCRIGANAVIAPGTLLARQTIVQRLQLVDHETG